MLFAPQSKNELFTQEMNQSLIRLTTASDSETLYKIFDAGARGGSIIYAITVVTNDEQSRLLSFYESYLGGDFLKDTISLPLSTMYGYDGANHELNILPQMAGIRMDSAGNRSLYLAPGKSLKVKNTHVPQADKEVIIRVYGENY